ncbi:MAG: family ATPase [Frankiales bacterium]|nr:family ATPase [Frankiales bacterium]
MSSAQLDALAVAVKADVPVLLWGSPGTGKTSAVLSLANALGWPVEVVVGAIREPSDFAGLPVVSDGDVHFAPPRWARRLAEAPNSLLLLDELTTAPPAVQAAMLRVVLERHVGDLALPAGVRIVAAANPPDEAADGWELSAPMANRLVHLDWSVDAETVARGLAVGFPPPTAVLSRPDSDAGQGLVARSLVGAFLQVRPALVLDVPKTSSAAGRGWPSPRSWETAARLVAAADAARATSEVRSLLVTGAVGEGAGLEFLSWAANLDLPDPAAVLADPDSFELPQRGDRAYAALAAVADYAVNHGTPELWDAAWRVVARVSSTAPDIAVLVARMLATRRPAGARIPSEVQALDPVLRAAGLLP